MPKNILIHEWEELLDRLEARYRPQEARKRSLTWRSAGLSITLQLTHNPANGLSMVPDVQVASSKTLDSALLLALIDLQERMDTVHVACRAYREVEGRVIWLQDAPCDYCGGNGGISQSCERCGGKGIRNKEDANGREVTP